VNISGLPWQNEQTPTILSRNALKSNVLCQRHNSALSPIDDVASDFLTALDQIRDDFQTDSSRNSGRAVLFNGQMGKSVHNDLSQPKGSVENTEITFGSVTGKAQSPPAKRLFQRAIWHTAKQAPRPFAKR
jgi:hypothetical protein